MIEKLENELIELLGRASAEELDELLRAVKSFAQGRENAARRYDRELTQNLTRNAENVNFD